MAIEPKVAVFRIGGADIEIGPLPIWSLERCWDSIQALSKVEVSAFLRFEARLTIIASFLLLGAGDDWTVLGGPDAMKQKVEELKKQTTWVEAQDLDVPMLLLLRISGFQAAEGEATPEGEATAASPTGQVSSPS